LLADCQVCVRVKKSLPRDFSICLAKFDFRKVEEKIMLQTLNITYTSYSLYIFFRAGFWWKMKEK
jgi:hypothetical protein